MEAEVNSVREDPAPLREGESEEAVYSVAGQGRKEIEIIRGGNYPVPIHDQAARQVERFCL